MAILLDKAGTQHYVNKMVLAENRKVGSKSLPSALADVDNLIEEMKGHFEAEYGSALDMKLENNENVFSVGTGSGLDKREEVENSFTDVEIKGRTLQNLGSIQYCNLPAHATVVDTNIITMSIKNHRYNHFSILKTMFKPSTTYTLLVNMIQNNGSPSTIEGEVEQGRAFSMYSYSYSNSIVKSSSDGNYACGFSHREVGLKKCSFITHDLAEFNEKPDGVGFSLETFYSATSGEQRFQILILEGDYTNTPLSELPYVEGIQGVGEEVENGYEVEVKSCGKNLWNEGLGYRLGAYQSNGNEHANNTHLTTNGYIKVSPNTRYYATSNCYDYVVYFDGKKKFITFNFNSSKGFTTPQNCMFITIVLKPIPYSTKGNWLQVEESSTPTPYEPYVEDTLTYTLEEPLHRLPNGVCDEIKDGKLIRRIGKVVLDGTVNPAGAYGQGCNENYRTIYYNSIKYKDNTRLICDKFKEYTISNNKLGVEECVLGGTGGGGAIFLSIETKKLSQNSNIGMLEWLQANPTTVYYELTTPVITELPTPSLQCWKNGTISIDSTVPPTTTHTVALNKPAQIKRNIEELTTLRHKVKTLEEQYDQIALEQAHKLELLNHSFELDYNI